MKSDICSHRSIKPFLFSCNTLSKVTVASLLIQRCYYAWFFSNLKDSIIFQCDRSCISICRFFSTSICFDLQQCQTDSRVTRQLIMGNLGIFCNFSSFMIQYSIILSINLPSSQSLKVRIILVKAKKPLEYGLNHSLVTVS